MRFRREVRAIRFQHKLVQGRCGGCFTDIFSILESDNSGETNERALGEHQLHGFGIASEAMKHPADSVREWLHLRQCLWEAISALVDDAVQAHLSGNFEMLAEKFSLPTLVICVILGRTAFPTWQSVEVQAGF